VSTADSGRWWRWTAALAAALLLSRTWTLAHRAIDLDEFEHAHAAWATSHGAIPYVDFFEHHPPALYLVSSPIFARFPVATDPDAAMHALFAARAAMWILTLAAALVVYRLASAWTDAAGGIAAVLLLATASRYLDSMLEFRPDVPAMLALLAAAGALTAAARASGRRTTAWCAAAGLAFGIALLFTQKVIFAAPGLAVAVAATERRTVNAGAFAAAACAPIAGVVAWFAGHGAVDALWHYTIVVNGRLNADQFPPWPRIASQLVQQPGIYLLGAAGWFQAARRLRTAPDRIAVVAVAASLAAGLFVIGKAYDQYFALLLPLLAVLGGTAARTAPARTALAVAVALAVVAVANDVRRFEPNSAQRADIAWVTTHTPPDASYLGGSPGPALFRPHAWFYFFLTGPFASDEDFARLLDRLRAGDVRPALLIDDQYLARAPAPLLAYLRGRFRPVASHAVSVPAN